MKAPLWALELANEFWKAAGFQEPFPRQLRRPITYALQGSIQYLHGMRLEGVKDYLQQRGIPCPCDRADRPLRACLVAHVGWAIIFIDGTDPEDEQRFSLAHELAHYLRDYWQPRRLACQRLGNQVLDVFDGLRSPTTSERLHALLARFPLGAHVHLMERRKDGGFGNLEIVAAEQDADRLAFELLAPAQDIAKLKARGLDRDSLPALLRQTYGLPADQASGYAHILWPATPRDPLLQRLFKNRR